MKTRTSKRIKSKKGRPSRGRPRRGRLPTAAQIKKWRAAAFRAAYQVEVLYNGHDPALDKQITKIVGRQSDSSGMSLLIGLRDIQYRFSQKTAAIVAADRLWYAKHQSGDRKLRGLRIFLRTYEEQS